MFRVDVRIISFLSSNKRNHPCNVVYPQPPSHTWYALARLPRGPILIILKRICLSVSVSSPQNKRFYGEDITVREKYFIHLLIERNKIALTSAFVLVHTTLYVRLSDLWIRLSFFFSFFRQSGRNIPVMLSNMHPWWPLTSQWYIHKCMPIFAKHCCFLACKISSHSDISPTWGQGNMSVILKCCSRACNQMTASWSKLNKACHITKVSQFCSSEHLFLRLCLRRLMK